MRLALELEFPDEQAAPLMSRLQSLPGLVMRFIGSDALAQEPLKTGLFVEKAALQPAPAETVLPGEELSEAEQHRLLHEVFGSWQSEESGEEMVRRIYADRQDQPREVDL